MRPFARGIASTCALAAWALVACDASPPSGAPSAATSTSTTPVGIASPSASNPYPRAEDDALPVYRPTKDPPDPTAQKYCDLIHEEAERTRQRCCPSSTFTPFRPTEECVRTLSIALQSGAITFAEGGLAACEAAVKREALACDWGGVPPVECANILVGTRGEDIACRSSLECAKGAYCRGLGVTTPGRCAPTAPEGAECANGVDTLASFVRQDTEREHASCHDVCLLRRCKAFVAEGGACTTALQCGPAKTCSGGKCTAEIATDRLGQRRIGDACKDDSDCRSGACETGHCAMRCGLALARPQPSAPGR